MESMPGYADTEKRTPLAGKFLLLLMVVTSLAFAWQALDTVSDIPQRPESLSSCVWPFLPPVSVDEAIPVTRQDMYAPVMAYPSVPMKYEAVDYRPTCIFSAYEKEVGLDQLLKKRDDALRVARSPLEKTLGETDVTLGIKNNELRIAESQYQTALTEKIAGGVGIYTVAELQKKIHELQVEVSALQQKADDLRGQIQSLVSGVTAMDSDIRRAATTMYDVYRHDWYYYQFLIFLIQAIFVVPMFFLVYRQYLRLSKKDSPYAIIFSALLFVVGILLARILLVWFWSLFLARLIRVLWRFIQSTAILKSIILYTGMLLSIGIFGGSAWYLQKKIYDPRRVALRRLRNHECPGCQASLDLAGVVCPVCGCTIRTMCSVCGKERFAALPHCPHCGQ